MYIQFSSLLATHHFHNFRTASYVVNSQQLLAIALSQYLFQDSNIEREVSNFEGDSYFVFKVKFITRLSAFLEGGNFTL